MNILYVCNPYDVHDRKWMIYFANKPGFKLFATWEKAYDAGTTQADYDAMAANKITPLPSFESFSFKSPFETRRSIKHINKLIKDNNIDVFHILFATPYALWGAYVNIPYVITARGSDVLIVIPELQTKGGITGILSKYLFKIFKKSFNNAALITGTSSRQITTIKKVLSPAAPIELIRTGIDADTIMGINTDEFLPEQLKGKEYIFSPRYIRPVYNLELQIAAIKLLPAEVLRRYKFVFIYGRDEYFERVKAELATIEGLDYIIFDVLTQMQMWTIYRYAKLTFMVPHSDGTPNTALEAMAARCPLILRNLEAYDKELFDGTCVKLKDDSPQTFANTIVECLDAYPESLLDEAQNKVMLHGNRAVEMEKLYQWYLKIGEQKH